MHRYSELSYTLESKAFQNKSSAIFRIVRMISLSADLEELSIMTPGLTGGGGTGKTVMSIQSGRVYLMSNPRASQSSSLIRLRISCAFSAEISYTAKDLSASTLLLNSSLSIQPKKNNSI